MYRVFQGIPYFHNVIYFYSTHVKAVLFIYLCLLEQSGLLCPDFYETHKCSEALCEYLML
jgi:hypothetical protein